MRSLILATGALVGLTGLAFGQTHAGPYWSLGGFGNVVYPGTGHAPAATPPGGGSFVNSFASRGGVVAGHPQHRRNNVVLYPVYYGGYGYGAGYGAGYACDPSQGCTQGYPDQPPVVNSGAPGVVINQNFVPPQASPQVREYGSGDANGDQSSSGFRMYQAPTPGQTVQSQQAPSDNPTLYLIAFKDHSVVQALGYWMEGSTLHYVTVDHDLNQVSLDLIDRDLSQRLNNERNVEFRLPAAR